MVDESARLCGLWRVNVGLQDGAQAAGKCWPVGFKPLGGGWETVDLFVATCFFWEILLFRV